MTEALILLAAVALWLPLCLGIVAFPIIFIYHLFIDTTGDLRP